MMIAFFFLCSLTDSPSILNACSLAVVLIVTAGHVLDSVLFIMNRS